MPLTWHMKLSVGSVGDVDFPWTYNNVIRYWTWAGRDCRCHKRVERMSEEWWEDHECSTGDWPKCWREGSEDFICDSCGQKWPACLTHDELACVYATGDWCDDDEFVLLEAEVERRGYT